MSGARAVDDGPGSRNRRVVLILLVVMGALALATLLAGIRW
jgi:hypothetical protein